jgi:hypothetical protein
LVEFKFLLRDSSGKFQWQSGPNRSLQTGGTAKTLVVYEDWGDEKNQKVVKEGDASVQMAELVATDDDKSINDDVNSTVAVISSLQGESVKACEADLPEVMV